MGFPAGLLLVPDVITINGSTNNITFVSRSNYGTDLASEGDDTEDQFWVKCIVNPTNSPYLTAEVDFPDGFGSDRIYSATNLFVIP